MKEKVYYPKDSGITKQTIIELVLQPLGIVIEPSDQRLTDEFCQMIVDTWDNLWEDEDTLDEEFKEEFLEQFEDLIP